MNTRNIDALRRMIDVLGYGWPDERAKMAHDLAAAGVLVPSALTDEQARAATDEGINPDTTMGGPHEYLPEDLRTALTNIAKAGVTRLPWALPTGERLRSGDNVAVDPVTGKLVRWRNGLTHFCYTRKDVAEGETLSSADAMSG